MVNKNPLLPSIAEDRIHEASLDGLRGIAVLMVLCHHAVLYVKSPFLSSRAKQILEYGWIGTLLFFLLSAYTLRRSWELRKSSQRTPVRNFYIRRAFRILPFWWLNVIVCCLVRPWHWLPLLANLTLIMNWFATSDQWIIVPFGWSICLEESFYWLFPLWTKLLHNATSALIALVCGLVVSYVWDWHAPSVLGPMENHEFYFAFPLSRYYIFFLGFFTYFLMENTEFKKFLQSFSQYRIPWLDLFFVFFAHQVGLLFPTLMVWILFLLSFNPKTYIGKISRSPVLGKIGIVCYSMYLLHGYVMEYISRFQKDIFDVLHIPAIAEAELAVLIPLASIVTFAVSVISYRLIELPSVKFGRKILTTYSSQ